MAQRCGDTIATVKGSFGRLVESIISLLFKLYLVFMKEIKKHKLLIATSTIMKGYHRTGKGASKKDWNSIQGKAKALAAF